MSDMADYYGEEQQMADLDKFLKSKKEGNKMTQKHTPGKWKIFIDVQGNILIYADNDKKHQSHHVINICKIPHHYQEVEVNAKLIAKAWLIPKMTEKLKKYIGIVDAMSRVFGGDEATEDFQIETKALIKEIEDNNEK